MGEEPRSVAPSEGGGPPRGGWPLHVLFTVRPGLERSPGGDTVQIGKTAAALERLGVRVTIASDPTVDLTPFDLVHLWHLERVHETYLHLQRACEAGMPTVLSPIYWPLHGGPDAGGAERLRPVAENGKNVLRLVFARTAEERRLIVAALRAGWRTARARALRDPQLLLPNSRAEATLLARESGRADRLRVVVNGVDPSELEATSPAASRPIDVLCVGHFDPRKNQLVLVNALRDAPINVIFIGGARPHHQRYYRRCRRAAGPRMKFLGAQPPDRVREAMRRARVHACPSHVETPGLANLEAAVLGCRLAVTDFPVMREYFGDDAVYFEGRDPRAVREGVLACLEGSESPDLRERILAAFTWDRAARQTLEAYREVQALAAGRGPAEASGRRRAGGESRS